MKKGGVALLIICLGAGPTHALIALDVDTEWIYLFDPYLRKAQRNTYQENVILLESDGYSPNYRVRREWMDRTDPKMRFNLGPESCREAMLFKRIK